MGKAPAILSDVKAPDRDRIEESQLVDGKFGHQGHGAIPCAARPSVGVAKSIPGRFLK